VVFLEVRLGNEKAIALYRRLGFREAGRRKSYYHDGEDAWLMQYRYMDQAKECNAV
jgi:ribosomal-protein-alanine N-acetyltransferase